MIFISFATQLVALFTFATAGVWCTLYFEHSLLCHRQGKITKNWWYNMHVILCWPTHFGSNPYQWAISHRLHHMFGDVKRLDPYSSIVVGYWKILFNSAGHLGEYNSREGHADIFPDLEMRSWEKKLYSLRRWWLIPVLAIWFIVIPQLLLLGASLMLHLVSTVMGTAYGFAGVFVVLLGGGLINSYAHWRRKRRQEPELRLALDGTTSDNHTLFANLTLLRELLHLNHHDRPTEFNFGFRKWYQLDLVYQISRVWQLLRLNKIGYREEYMEVNMNNLISWDKRYGDPEDLDTHEARVSDHIPWDEKAKLSEDRFVRSAEIGVLIITGKLRENSGIPLAAT